MFEQLGALIAWAKERSARFQQKKLRHDAEFWCDKVPHGGQCCPNQCELCAEADGSPVTRHQNAAE